MWGDKLKMINVGLIHQVGFQVSLSQVGLGLHFAELLVITSELGYLLTI